MKRRKLNREELAGTSPFLREEERHEPFFWRVYEEYEVVDDGTQRPYLTAVKRQGSDSPRQSRVYRPLNDAPNLFLDFARIEDQRDPLAALNRWIASYGLLGLDAGDYPSQHRVLGNIYRSFRYPNMVWPPIKYRHEGGPGETVAAIWEQAQIANEVLALYEAALDKNERELERLVYETEDPEALESWRQRFRNELEGEHIDFLISAALMEVRRLIEPALAAFTHPVITAVESPASSNPRLTPDKLVASWRPRNLLGAMYLQFFWLVTSAGDLSRCKQCGRIIPYAPLLPQDGNRKPRKPRSDKEFCSTQCRQNYHYQNRKKLKRQKSEVG